VILKRLSQLACFSLVFCLWGCLSTVAQEATHSPSWDTYSDTWVGTDGLGRILPTAQEAGPPRANKTVALFYFLTFDRGGDGPYDNTQILKTHPEALNDVHNPAWGPLNSSHYWGQPLFGYYASDDEWVLRKHAHMLANAGIDVVIFDNSNAVTYDKARETLCQVWEDIRRHGGRTPQIAFLCPFGNPSNIGGSTLRSLYESLYGPGRYKDLWFQWEGKPLVLADPSYANAEAYLQATPHQPTALRQGGTLGQAFTAEKPFISVGGEFPTWSTQTSGMTLSLYTNGPGGKLRVRRTFQNVPDNAAVSLGTPRVLPAGRYYLEMSHSVGQIGWWSYTTDVYGAGQALEEGLPVSGDRALHIHYVGEGEAQALSPKSAPTTPEAAEAKAQSIRQFFTFRTPIAPYNLQSPPPSQWAWLQIYPQAPQRNAAGQVEEVTVGVAQNYNAVVNRTAPMSVPGAFGRSYHAGHLDTRPEAVRYGFNFAEQWNRALQIDPPFVFVTGWNEWTAGFYDDWAGFHAPPAIFVDEFTEEYSRDIEPMKNETGTGHGDDYYYQLAANIRRYKGVRALPPVTAKTIHLTDSFDQWNSVGPEFRDALGDTVHRNSPGSGHAGPYVNATGRNDIVAAKVSYDAKNVYFCVRTAAKLTPQTDPDWMLLYLNTPGKPSPRWLGYDFVVNRRVGAKTASLEKNIGGNYQWQAVGQVRYTTRGSHLMLSIPLTLLGLASPSATIDFKWADHCYAHGDWTDFTLNGDAAPDDRFNYHARLTAGKP
jgi:hypothetical protein